MRLTLLALIALRNQTIFLLFSFAPFIVQFADEKRAPEALIDGAYRACRVTRLRYPNAPSTVYSRPVSCQTPSSQPSFSVASICSATIQLIACPTRPRPFARTAPAPPSALQSFGAFDSSYPLRKLARSTPQLRTVPLPPSRTKTTCYEVGAVLSCATRVLAAVRRSDSSSSNDSLVPQ